MCSYQTRVGSSENSRVRGPGSTPPPRQCRDKLRSRTCLDMHIGNNVHRCRRLGWPSRRLFCTFYRNGGGCSVEVPGATTPGWPWRSSGLRERICERIGLQPIHARCAPARCDFFYAVALPHPIVVTGLCADPPSRDVARRPRGRAAAFSSCDDSVVTRRYVGWRVTTSPNKTTPRGGEATCRFESCRSHRSFFRPRWALPCRGEFGGAFCTLSKERKPWPLNRDLNLPTHSLMRV